MAQKVHRRSQPEASFSGALGPPAQPAAQRRVRWPARSGRQIRDGRRAPGTGGGRRGAAGRPGSAAAACGGPAACATRAAPRPGSPRSRAGDVGDSRRSRAPRRPRAAPRPARRRTARPGSRPRRPPGRRPVAFRSAAASSVSTESFLALSTKPQVLTSTASASSGSSTSRKPPARAGPPAPRSRPRCGRNPG